SRVSASAIVKVHFDSNASSGAFIMDVGFSGERANSAMRLTDQNGNDLSRSTNSNSPYIIDGKPGAIYYLTADLVANTSNQGECCDDQKHASSRIDVRLRKAPILATNGRFEPFIRGGEETSAYPYVGAILIDGRLHCTGTVIGPKTILT